MATHVLFTAVRIKEWSQGVVTESDSCMLTHKENIDRWMKVIAKKIAGKWG